MIRFFPEMDQYCGFGKSTRSGRYGSRHCDLVGLVGSTESEAERFMPLDFGAHVTDSCVSQDDGQSQDDIILTGRPPSWQVRMIAGSGCQDDECPPLHPPTPPLQGLNGQVLAHGQVPSWASS